MKWALGAGLVAVLGALLMLGGLISSLPMVADRNLVKYSVVTDEMGLEIPWHALVAVDAVRFRQDFSGVDRESIEETASLFALCQGPGIRDWTVAYNPDERFERAFSVLRPATLTWTLEVLEGEVYEARILDEQDGVWASGSVLEAGTYRLVVDAEPEKSVYQVVISLESVARCGPDEVRLVLSRLGLDEDDQQMGLALMAAFLPPGEFLFHPHPDSLFSLPLEAPWRITSPFGYRLDPVMGGWYFHTGVDIGAPEGTPIRAAASGTVWFADELGDYGLMVRIDHGAFSTAYGHLSEVYVEPGQVIGKGAVLGLVGNTGKSTGPHLHLEWWIDESYLDPLAAYR